MVTLLAGEVVKELLVPNPESAVLLLRPRSKAGLLPDSSPRAPDRYEVLAGSSMPVASNRALRC